VTPPGAKKPAKDAHMQYESDNSTTRDLRASQTFALTLDVGIWSGNARRTEIAESFQQPLVTVCQSEGLVDTSSLTIPIIDDATRLTFSTLGLFQPRPEPRRRWRYSREKVAGLGLFRIIQQVIVACSWTNWFTDFRQTRAPHVSA
jgi:hypothetical protein